MCADCAASKPEAFSPLAQHTHVSVGDWILPKIVMNPDRSGCPAVHQAECGKHLTKVDAGVAYLAHFTNWIVWRADDGATLAGSPLQLEAYCEQK
jgi:hypothetical protein